MRIQFDELDELTRDDVVGFTAELARGGASAEVTGTAQPFAVGDLGEIVTQVSVVAGNLGLVAFVVAAVRDRFRRGVVVDATGSELELRPDRRLPNGSVTVIAPQDASVTVDRGADLASVLAPLLPQP